MELSAAGAQHEREGVEDIRPRPVAALGEEDVDDRDPADRSQGLGEALQVPKGRCAVEEVAEVRSSARS